MWAGIAVLSDSKEMLGAELRDVFDAHPPKPAGDELAPALESMQIWTPEGRQAAWPYGVEWYRDTYPMPYWARVQQQREQQQQQQQASSSSTGMSSS